MKVKTTASVKDFPITLFMSEMREGDIGVVVGGDYEGEYVLAVGNPLRCVVALGPGRLGDSWGNPVPTSHMIRLLNPGEGLTLEVERV